MWRARVLRIATVGLVRLTGEPVVVGHMASSGRMVQEGLGPTGLHQNRRRFLSDPRQPSSSVLSLYEVFVFVMNYCAVRVWARIEWVR